MGIKDISDNLLNKGEHVKEQVKPSDLSSMEAEFAEITTKLEQERQTREGLGRFMKHPIQVLTEKPENILIVCIPVGLLFFLIGSGYMIGSYGMSVLFKTTSIDDLAVFAVLICIVPLAILDFREQSRIKNLENALPNFFRDLAGMNDSGMTLPNAVQDRKSVV